MYIYIHILLSYEHSNTFLNRYLIQISNNEKHNSECYEHEILICFFSIQKNDINK